MILSISALNNKLGHGEISFEVIDGEPYVKVGADAVPKKLASDITFIGAASFTTTSDTNRYANLTAKSDGYILFAANSTGGEKGVSGLVAYGTSNANISVNYVICDTVVRSNYFVASNIVEVKKGDDIRLHIPCYGNSNGISYGWILYTEGVI